jgi:DNA mismatch endonuclease (patch repair protein)
MLCEALVQAGWQVLVIWECDLGDLRELKNKLQFFLGPTGAASKLEKGS